MGMDLYNNSPAARAVQETADSHLLAVYGFSIVEIVKDNAKEKNYSFRRYQRSGYSSTIRGYDLLFHG
jgi:malonyl CoA-acyl carrier protein transacylase